MTALGSLVVSLEANMARFTGEMSKAAYQTEQAMQRMQRSADYAQSALVGLAKGAAAMVTVDAFANLIKGAVDSLDALNDLRDATGSSVENLSALEDVALRTGANMDTVASAMIKFQKLLLDAKPGDTATSGMKALGLSVQELKNLDPADAMLQYAKALSNFADDGSKARLVLDQTGKSVRELAPFFKDLAEQEKLVATVTRQQTEEAEKFNKELFAMQKNVDDAARWLSGPLVTSINQTIALFRDGAKEGKSFYSVLVGEQMRLLGLNDGPKEYAARLEEINKQLAGGEKRLLVRSALLREQAELEKKLAETPNFAAGNDRAAARLLRQGANIKPSVGDVPVVKPKPTGAPVKSDAEKLAEDAQRFVARLKEQAETFGQSGTAVLEYQMALSKFPQVYKDEAIALQKRIDAQKAAAEDQKASTAAAQKALAEQERDTQRNEGNVARIRISLMNEADQQTAAHELILAELNTFHDAKFENVALANELIEQENARHLQVLADMQTARDMQSLAAMGNTADMLYSLMQKAGQEQNMLAKAAFLASKAIAVAEIIMQTNVAAAKAQGQLGIFGLPMSGIIMANGYAQAGMVAGMAIAGMREKGGPVYGGGAYIVGEKGPEIFKPTGSGTIIPNSALGGASGAPMTLTIVNNTSAKIGQVTEQRISPTERALIIQEAAAQTAAQLSDPNSRTSRAMSRSYAVQRSR